MNVTERLLAIPSAILITVLYSITITACALIFIPRSYIKAGSFGVGITWQGILEINYIFTTAIWIVAQGKFVEAEKYLDENMPD